MSRMPPSAVREILKVAEQPDVLSFAGGLPAPELFPVEAIAEAHAEVLAKDGRAALQYSTTEGFGPLREWVVDRLARRGVRAVSRPGADHQRLAAGHRSRRAHPARPRRHGGRGEPELPRRAPDLRRVRGDVRRGGQRRRRHADGGAGARLRGASAAAHLRRAGVPQPQGDHALARAARAARAALPGPPRARPRGRPLRRAALPRRGAAPARRARRRRRRRAPRHVLEDARARHAPRLARRPQGAGARRHDRQAGRGPAHRDAGAARRGRAALPLRLRRPPRAAPRASTASAAWPCSARSSATCRGGPLDATRRRALHLGAAPRGPERRRDLRRAPSGRRSPSSPAAPSSPSPRATTCSASTTRTARRS